MRQPQESDILRLSNERYKRIVEVKVSHRSENKTNIDEACRFV